MTQNKSYDANTLFAAIAIIPFLVPNGLQTFSFMRIVYDLKYLSFIIIALLTFGNGKIRRKGNDLILAIISFSLIMIVISALQKTNVADAVTRMFNLLFATVYKGNIIKNLIMDCQSYAKYRPNETTGGIFVSWRRKEELPTGA